MHIIKILSEQLQVLCCFDKYINIDCIFDVVYVLFTIIRPNCSFSPQNDLFEFTSSSY